MKIHSKFILLFIISLNIAACGTVENNSSTSDKLTQIIEQRSDDERARDEFRHPKETLEFFGIQPGMSVVEVLPGGGWYSRILAPYLGDKGTLHAVNYADNMWDLFGIFSAETIAKRKAHMSQWPGLVGEYGGNNSSVKGFTFGQIPAEIIGTVDAVLFIRAVHNLNRFEQQAGTRTAALNDTFKMLKPGGIVGLVQHRAPATASNDWANGKNGYLKRDAVIDMFEEVGFKLVASSQINNNPNDKPTAKDYVWRLRPSLRLPTADPALLEKVKAIGESDRMTLKFIKPK